MHCTEDRASPPGTQEKMIETIRESNASVIVKRIDASHSPMLSRPDETVVFIEEAAKWFLGFTQS
jgi:pimeloyl-ACP methyl ester carboxylesterase